MGPVYKQGSVKGEWGTGSQLHLRSGEQVAIRYQVAISKSGRSSWKASASGLSFGVTRFGFAYSGDYARLDRYTLGNGDINGFDPKVVLQVLGHDDRLRETVQDRESCSP